MKILNGLSVYVLKSSLLTGLVMGLMGGLLLVAPLMVPAGLKALYGFLKARTVAAGKHVASRRHVYGVRAFCVVVAVLYPLLFVFLTIREHVKEIPGDLRALRDAWTTGTFA